MIRLLRNVKKYEIIRYYQVAHSKSLALNIVNSRLRELENRRYRDASTETDANAGQTEKDFTRRARKLSPGRAMLHLKLPGIFISTRHTFYGLSSYSGKSKIKARRNKNKTG